ncbi:hypothetical protein D3C85_571920 [compost metagenome]
MASIASRNWPRALCRDHQTMPLRKAAMMASKPTLTPIHSVRVVSAAAAIGRNTPGVGVITTALMATK